MPALRVQRGPRKGAILALPAARVRIGRATANDIVLADRTVSREHAVLVRRSGAWYIQDVGSHNRVLVNGVPMISSVVTDGDEIQLGDVRLTFLRQEDGEAPPALDQEGEASTEVTEVIPLDEALEHQPAADRHLGNLLNLGELAVAVRTIPALFEGLGTSLRKMLDAERVVPLLREEDGRWRPYVAGGHSFREDIDGLGLDRSLLERAHQEGPVAAQKAGGPEGSVVCVPIRVGPRDLGAIYCERVEPAFGQEELRYLFYIAVGLGVAMEGLRAQQQLVSRTRSLSRQLADHYDMVGESEAMKHVYRFIHRAAPTDAGVFICGESGTGKEMVAQAIHRHSHRSGGPLEIVNCAAVPATLMESELFGHVKGAFTGAVADRPGRFELADGGTLFLDEVVELPTECQTKLLRILEEAKVRCIGDTKDREVDVRLVAATNRDPRQAVAENRLRADLFYRLDRLRVVVPPLREREGDIVRLAEHFRLKFSQQCKRAVDRFSCQALETLRAYEWPGNVRELRNVVERMVILSEGPVLGLDLIPENVRTSVRSAPNGCRSLAEVERDHIVRALERTEGNKSRAAEVLGIDRSTLYAKLKKYEIDA